MRRPRYRQIDIAAYVDEFRTQGNAVYVIQVRYPTIAAALFAFYLHAHTQHAHANRVMPTLAHALATDSSVRVTVPLVAEIPTAQLAALGAWLADPDGFNKALTFWAAWCLAPDKKKVRLPRFTPPDVAPILRAVAPILSAFHPVFFL